jgi:hypothetical protein
MRTYYAAYCDLCTAQIATPLFCFFEQYFPLLTELSLNDVTYYTLQAVHTNVLLAALYSAVASTFKDFR